MDETPVRAIVRIQARYGPYRIFVTELRDAITHKYRYYVLQGQAVIVGFDNSPDPRALRLRYGRIGNEQVRETVPHQHAENKTQVLLTKEFFFSDFVSWLQENLSF
jgi:hypothetical protein